MESKEVDFIEISKCKNCKHYENGFCKQRPSNLIDRITGEPLNWEETNPEDHCSLFDLDEIKFNALPSKDMKKPKENKKSPYLVFEKEGQALSFMKEQPLFYDKSDMWWLWDEENSKWEITDKTQILTEIKNTIGANVISSKERTEIINALQVVGREHMPEILPIECIQFKDRIINLKTGEEFKSSPNYFSTNPILWNIGESEETPTMDKLFTEWVGEKYKDTLYEIIAYAACSEQFMQRMIALVGGGSNGKGTYIKLLRKFIGEHNCASSELYLLSTNQFETSSLYKKLVCEMGEVSHDDLQNSNQIKKLSGEDKIRYCFKGKTPFTDSSPTTCLINTNSLPVTNDKTTGFYRRWLIVDFPNQFPIRSGILESIPDKEYENLSRKVISILKRMYKEQKFTNEGDYKERADRYEERSNPIMKFIETHCEEDYESYISLNKFSKTFNDYLKDKHLRTMNVKEIKSSLAEEGFEIQRTTKNYVRDMYILNLKLKIIQNIQNIQENEIHFIRENLISKNGIIGIKWIKSDLIEFFKKNLEKIIDFEEIEGLFEGSRDILNKLKEEGVICEIRKDKFQYLG